MKRSLIYITLIAVLFGMACKQSTTTTRNVNMGVDTLRVYSDAIADSFSIFVYAPKGYNAEDSLRFPVVYLIDANIYADVMGTSIKSFADVGMLPNVFLVGIGYKNFGLMDSLRDRDYTYPKALTADSFSTSGGADKFLSFIQSQVIPKIDKKYKTDTAQRVLMGHSLGGYFTLYALLENIRNKKNAFSGYIAASPSIDYCDEYLTKELEKIKPIDRAYSPELYLTFGGQENAENEQEGVQMTKMIERFTKTIKTKNVEYKYDLYSNFGHMDTPIPSFYKGLQYTFEQEED